jgi:uncharacterized protein (DUF1800 family)
MGATIKIRDRRAGAGGNDMGHLRIPGVLLALGLLAAAGSPPALAAEPTATAVEYYNATLKHYFVTAYPEEAAMLDMGVLVPGWKRTGAEFGVWANAGDAPGIVPVCRFFGPNVGNTHVYTGFPASECDDLKKNPAWQYEGIAFYIALPVANSCAAGTTPVYRSWRGVSLADNNHRFVTDLTLHERMAGPATVLEGIVMCSPLKAKDIEADAVRLLEQATFGPTDAAIEHVKAVGAAAFVGEQLAMPRADTSLIPWMPASKPASCVDDATLPLRPDSFCNRDNYTLYPNQRMFFVNAVAGPDQLRQRVAFALSQILVISGSNNQVTMAYGMQRYQQMLADLAFDNYEKILTQVTLSPQMGNYLDMVNNRKPNAATGIQANENYAREVMQLFSIGLWKLNLDGTQVLDASGNPIPTYGLTEINGFARVFTGWTYPTAPGATRPTGLNGTVDYSAPMEERAAEHDTTSKVLLDGAVATANLSMSSDLSNALSNIFHHPNVGPFISKALIQKLVTGDPTPQYVARVATVFNDNGAGVRGDLRAVVAAILLDPEARGGTKLDRGYGKLREPALFVTGMLRALNATTDGAFFQTQFARGTTDVLYMGENVYMSPTVFNYYPPDYVVPGTNALGPEFGIQNTTSAFARVNFANSMIFSAIPVATNLYGATGTQLDWSALQSVAGDPAALVAKLDRLLMHNTMSPDAKNAVITAVTAAGTDPLLRARTAFYLVATSSQYQVER